VSIKQTLRTSVAAGALLALVAPFAFSSSASAGKADVTFSGQIMRGLLFADDGVNSGVFIVDNWMSDSRINVKVSGQLTESVSVAGGLRIKFKGAKDASFDSASGDKSMTGSNGAALGTDAINIGFKHKSMGSLAIGNIALAGDGALEQNYLGGGWAQGWGAMVGPAHAFKFIDTATGIANDANGRTTSAGAAKSIGPGTFDDYDSSSPDAVRYTTPTFNGTSLATSITQNGDVSFGASYGGSFGGVDVISRAFYNNNHASTTDGSLASTAWGAGVGVLHSSGLNATVFQGVKKRAGASDTAASSSKRVGGGVGYNTNLSSLGETGLFVTYNEITDDQSKGDKYTSYQIGVGQAVDSIGMQFVLEYIRAKYTDTTDKYNDIDMVYFATKLPF
jgi:hypothetical protein